jgi:hypothetical protein
MHTEKCGPIYVSEPAWCGAGWWIELKAEDRIEKGEERKDEEEKPQERPPIALSVCAEVPIPSRKAETVTQPTQQLRAPAAVAPLHLHFAVVEVASGPVVFVVVVVLFQLLVEFGNQAIITLVVVA